MDEYATTIPICFATDEEYLGLTSVAIKSIVNTSNKENYYDIHIFHSKISFSEQQKILNLSDKKNVKITFDNVKNYIDDSKLYIKSECVGVKYSAEAYYRILIPEILRQYDKVVYLDGDTIILTDIKKLFDVDIENNLLGAVRDLYGINDCKYSRKRFNYTKKILKIDNINDLFISGVLIINNKEFNKKYKWQELMSVCFSYNWQHHDQDVLNKICYGKTKLISPEWGVMPLYKGIFKKLPESIKNDFYSSYKMEKKLIHYGGTRKPWKKGYTIKSKEFWQYASETPYFDKLIKKCIEPEIRWLALTSVFGNNYNIENDKLMISKYCVCNLRDFKMIIYNIDNNYDCLQFSAYTYCPWYKNNKTVQLKIETNEKKYYFEPTIKYKKSINNSYYDKVLITTFNAPGNIYSISIIDNQGLNINPTIICNIKYCRCKNEIFQITTKNNTLYIDKKSKLQYFFDKGKNFGNRLYSFLKNLSLSEIHYCYYTFRKTIKNENLKAVMKKIRDKISG